MLQGVDDRIPRVAYTIEEAARALGISASSLRRQIRAERLQILRIGGLVRIPVWALEQYARQSDHLKQSA